MTLESRIDRLERLLAEVFGEDDGADRELLERLQRLLRFEGIEGVEPRMARIREALESDANLDPRLRAAYPVLLEWWEEVKSELEGAA